MASKKALGAIVAFFGLTACALCITTLVLIADQLYPGGTWNFYNEATGEYLGTISGGRCLMTDNSINVCRYGYAVGAIGALSSIALTMAMCAPAVVSALLAAFNSIWFLGWAITATVYSNNIESSSMPDIPWQDYRQGYRHDVWSMAWAMFAVSLASLPLALMMAKGEAVHEAPPAEKPLPGVSEVPAKDASPAGYPAAV